MAAWLGYWGRRAQEASLYPEFEVWMQCDIRSRKLSELRRRSIESKVLDYSIRQLTYIAFSPVSSVRMRIASSII